MTAQSATFLRPHIGLTGGVASGKSTAARAFEALHPGCVVDADVASRAVVAPGSEGLAAVVARFGPEILAPTNVGKPGKPGKPGEPGEPGEPSEPSEPSEPASLNRAALRQRIFQDPQAKRDLEALLHPRIRAWMRARAAESTAPYVVLDIPLLTEGGGRAAWPMLDRVLVVDVPVAVQRARLLARDGIDAALAEKMIAAQASRAARLALADDVLVNLGRPEDLAAAVGRLDRRWR